MSSSMMPEPITLSGFTSISSFSILYWYQDGADNFWSVVSRSDCLGPKYFGD